ncbi:MAG: hypothetical protein ABI268_09030 [Rhodanobacter sp.]
MKEKAGASRLFHASMFMAVAARALFWTGFSLDAFARARPLLILLKNHRGGNRFNNSHTMIGGSLPRSE